MATAVRPSSPMQTGVVFAKRWLTSPFSSVRHSFVWLRGSGVAHARGGWVGGVWGACRKRSVTVPVLPGIRTRPGFEEEIVCIACPRTVGAYTFLTIESGTVVPLLAGAQPLGVHAPHEVFPNTGKCGGCSKPLMCGMWPGLGGADHQVLNISGARQFQAVCLLRKSRRGGYGYGKAATWCAQTGMRALSIYPRKIPNHSKELPELQNRTTCTVQSNKKKHHKRNTASLQLLFLANPEGQGCVRWLSDDWPVCGP